MTKNSTEEFIKNLEKLEKLKDISIGYEDDKCRKSQNCPVVGIVLSPSDKPEDVVDNWQHFICSNEEMKKR